MLFVLASRRYWTINSISLGFIFSYYLFYGVVRTKCIEVCKTRAVGIPGKPDDFVVERENGLANCSLTSHMYFVCVNTK